LCPMLPVSLGFPFVINVLKRNVYFIIFHKN
jgi:hypothetical protein